MTVEIRETIVTPASEGDVVQLRLSDERPDREFASFEVELSVRIPQFAAPVLAQLQRAAMIRVQKELTHQLQQLADEITRRGHDLEPKLRAVQS